MSYYNRRRRAQARLSDETIETIAESLAEPKWESSDQIGGFERVPEQIESPGIGFGSPAIYGGRAKLMILPKPLGQPPTYLQGAGPFAGASAGVIQSKIETKEAR